MSKLSEIDAELGDLLGKRETIEGVDIRRVKACLAACKGIETPDLESVGTATSQFDILSLREDALRYAIDVAHARIEKAEARANEATALLRDTNNLLDRLLSDEQVTENSSVEVAVQLTTNEAFLDAKPREGE